MNKKYFVLIEDKVLTKREINSIEKSRQKKIRDHANKILEINKSKIKEQINLKHVYGRVIISIDLEAKNSHTFENGSKIYIGRQFNNLNRRETEPVNAYVISAENIPSGVEILIHPNAIIDSNKIFGFNENISDVKYYSISMEQCYLWKNEEGDWMPLSGYVTALRVFEQYTGTLVGIDHKKIENVLYITSGNLKGKVVHTLKACDYEIIFMGKNGVEERVIRCRHFENEINDREEIVAVDDNLTKRIIGQDLLVGISSSDAKSIIFTL
jgi:hypothetical protein